MHLGGIDQIADKVPLPGQFIDTTCQLIPPLSHLALQALELVGQGQGAGFQHVDLVRQATWRQRQGFARLGKATTGQRRQHRGHPAQSSHGTQQDRQQQEFGR